MCKKVSIKERYVALTDFKSGKKEDLTFFKGDMLDVEDADITKNWWKAKNISTNKKGLIPRNFIIPFKQGLKDSGFFFNITPKEAYLKLMLARSEPGTFLIRPRQNTDTMIMCLKYMESVDKPNVANYVIFENSKPEIYIFVTKTFDTIFDLVRYYSEYEGLKCLIKQPYTDCYAVPPLNEFEISRDQIFTIEQIGKGAFGIVFRGLWNNKIEVAIKVMSDNSTLLSKLEFQKEAVIIQKLQHPFILQLIGVCSKIPPLSIITEYLPFGSICQFFKMTVSRELTVDHLIQMIFQVSQGMEYLVSMKVVHRDLRGDNILVSDDYTIKISDFGLARIVDDNIYHAKSAVVHFPMKWAAPELIVSGPKIFSERTDVWSFGVLCYEIMSRGKIPYGEKTSDEVLKMVANKETMQFQPDFICPPKVKELMKDCWNFEATVRPNFKSITARLRKLHCIDDE